MQVRSYIDHVKVNVGDALYIQVNVGYAIQGLYLIGQRRLCPACPVSIGYGQYLQVSKGNFIMCRPEGETSGDAGQRSTNESVDQRTSVT